MRLLKFFRSHDPVFIGIVGSRGIGEQERSRDAQSRPFRNRDQVIYALEEIANSLEQIRSKLGLTEAEFKEKAIIVSGGADGADEIGRIYAHNNEYDYIILTAKWGLHGRGAGHIRNARMIPPLDYLIVFHDGESPGTKGAIELAKKNKVTRRILRYLEKIPYLYR